MKILSSTLIKTIGCIFLFLIVVVACEQEKMPDVDPVYKFETGTLIDIDGNTYTTVKIGSQWWMKENLMVQHYRNGLALKVDHGLADTVWAKLDSGYYCSTAYNYFAVSSPNQLAPEGWHIASDSEWIVMEKYLGMEIDVADEIGWRGSSEGEKLKACYDRTSNRNWPIYQEVHNTNESGFTALPGTCRFFNGQRNSLEEEAFWWTSTTFGEKRAWYRHLDYQHANIFRYYAPFTSGFFVRCVKDR